ncbi:MAG: acyl-CoA desaturase [Akkermansiaceae bacterium]|nr:acyl-CoA desaturase [Akkermansiaceae bacterium]
MPLRIPFSRVDWLNTIVLFIIALLALIGAPLYLWNCGIDWFIGGMFAFYVFATGLSITLGYHRLFAHLSFRAKWPVKLFTLVFGACAFENSALNWVSDHRRHHKHTDQEDDPYDITRGFFWAHIGWILFKLNPLPPMDNVADLRKDRLVMWQYRWDKVIAVMVGLVLPAALGYWWNGWEGALGGFLLAGVLRVFLVQQCTFFINSLCHTIGRQPYSSKCSARDSVLMAFLTFGEGYHNFHHEFQHDYRNGVKPWNFDPTKWAIWLLSKIGLVSHCRRVSPYQILLAEIGEARRKADEQLAYLDASSVTVCERARGAVHELQDRLATAYHELERAIADRAETSRHLVDRWRREVRELLESLSKLEPLPA